MSYARGAGLQRENVNRKDCEREKTGLGRCWVGGESVECGRCGGVGESVECGRCGGVGKECSVCKDR